MKLTTFAGYDPKSPTLRASPTGGTCMGAEWRNVISWIDPAAPIVSGDFVRIRARFEDGVIISIIKRIECTRAGKWFAVCDDGIIPLVPWVFVPSSVEKVVARSPASPDECRMPAFSRSADDESRRIHEHFSREARVEWEQLGYPRGIRFPGVPALFPNRPDWCIAPEDRGECSHATLPPTNPTRPSEPLNFNAAATAGTLNLDWDKPNVYPRGTRYRLISANSPNDATIGSVWWEGDADFAAVPVIDPATRFWWVQAFANSLYGPFQPNTTGSMFRALPVDDRTFSQRAIVDEAFQFDAGSVHWYVHTPLFRVQSPAEILSGGVGLGGILRFHGNVSSPDDNQVTAKRTPPQIGVAGQFYAFSTRFMRPTSCDFGVTNSPAKLLVGLQFVSSQGLAEPNFVNSVFTLVGTPNFDTVAINISSGGGSVASQWMTAHGFVVGPYAVSTLTPYLRSFVRCQHRGDQVDIDNVGFSAVTSIQAGSYSLV